MSDLDGYRAFLAAKGQLATPSGLDVSAADVHPALMPHQRDAVVWAVRGGRRAIFASFGLGKSLMQLEACRLILSKLGTGRALIVCPLGVRQEFIRDALLIGVVPVFIRSEADAEREASPDGIYLTNYESVRDGRLNPTGFEVVSLDEAAILRGFGGTKTFRRLMELYEGSARYRFAATATPSPNEYIELLAYAAFLDIMDVGQAKTRYFKRDSVKADHLTLHPHMEREFWLWVSSWALFLTSPADLGYPDDGYKLPALDVRWHEVPSSFPAHLAAARGELFSAGLSLGVQGAAREKKESLDARMKKMLDLVAESPDDHFLLWHDLEAERHAIEASMPEAVTVWGTQDLDERERRIIAFSDGEIKYLATKPVIAGSGCNFQRHCHRAIFTGVGFKFHEFIQAIHRIHRFLQDEPVRIDLIYTEAEREIRADLERKWAQHDVMVARMGAIIREYGLAREAMAAELARSVGVERREASGDGYRLVNADSVEETMTMADNGVDAIITSIPFSNQYEYTPSYNDFGHTDDTRHFWEQMDFLTPELLRVLAPGRVCVIHVKDRVTPGGITGLGFQTVEPFHAEAIFHFRRHGFAFLGMCPVITDVVRENNQTYRLGWTEQCKDGTRMSWGLPEYLLAFRKPPTDASDGYADVPVVKSKSRYSRTRWQTDAHGYWRSDGNRPLKPEELTGLPADKTFQRFRDWTLSSVYDYEAHIAAGEALEAKGKLPSGFMLLQPGSWSEHLWADVARMRTLNMMQERKGQQFHLCPLQFDIVDRLIVRYTNPGDTVYDPFGGLMTVPYCAVKLGRKAIGVELNSGYFADGAAYVAAAAREMNVPTLFDLLDQEAV